MEKVYEYSIQFSNEIDNAEWLDLINAIEPNKTWYTIQIPLKSLEAALDIVHSFEKNAIKFTRFWKIIRFEKNRWNEEVVARSPQLVIYEKDEATKQDNFVKERQDRVEEINKMDKEFIIWEDFHGYKIFIERHEALFNPKISNRIKCCLTITFAPHAIGLNLNDIPFYLLSYISGNSRLLKNRFMKDFIKPHFPTVTRVEADSLLERIKTAYDDLNKQINS